jgi:hypothetical protein
MSPVVLGACTVVVGRTGTGVVAGAAGARVDAADGGACTAGAVGRPETSGTALTVVGVLGGDSRAVVVAAVELPVSVEPSGDDDDEVCFSAAADARLTVSAADARAAMPTHPAVIRRTLRRRASPLAGAAVVDRRAMSKPFDWRCRDACVPDAG